MTSLVMEHTEHRNTVDVSTDENYFDVVICHDLYLIGTPTKIYKPRKPYGSSQVKPLIQDENRTKTHHLFGPIQVKALDSRHGTK